MFLIGLSISQANAQGAITPKKEVKKEISVKGLLPILDLLFPKSVSAKESTTTDEAQDPLSTQPKFRKKETILAPDPASPLTSIHS